MPLNRLIDSGQPIVPPPDVQRTSLGLDALGRFVCNTWDEATAAGTRHFDAVVIGAGMFGGYCAEKIYSFGANNNLKVLVLDAGPFLIPTHLQNLPNIGLDVPDPLYPANDPGTARDLVWGMRGAETSHSSAKPTASVASRCTGEAGVPGFSQPIWLPGLPQSRNI